MIRIVHALQPKQKAALEDIGFGAILQLRCTKIDHGLCLWLVNNYIPTSYTLELYNSSIKISVNDVEFIMGLKAK